MKTSILPRAATVLLVLSNAAAQTQRTMILAAPAAPGQTMEIVVVYPPAAGGNLNVLLWSNPFPGVSTPVIPGLTLNGQARVDPVNFFSTSLIVFDPAVDRRRVPIAIPPNGAFLGTKLDTQSLDLQAATSTLFLSDNELEVAISTGVNHVHIAQATTTSTTAGDNDIQGITPTTIGTPTSLGIAPFSYLPILHRGTEGFVEGYAGTLTLSSHNSDIDSVSNRRVGRRLANLAYQVITCPNGYDISLTRDCTNRRQFSVLSHERATGMFRFVPGATWLDTGTSATPAQQRFYPGFSRDGQWGAMILQDSNTAVAGRVRVFRTNALTPAIDITATSPLSSSYTDATLAFTNHFLFVHGTAGWYWTSATAPTTLQPLALPNLAATNSPPQTFFPFSWRVSPDNSTFWFPIGSAAGRAEMDVVRVTNVLGTPSAVDYTQFATPTCLAEFGYSAVTAPVNTTLREAARMCVSPNNLKALALGASAATPTAFPGFYVFDGTPNPLLRTVPGAAFYSEPAFLNNTTAVFFAGPSNTAQSFYRLNVTTGAITQIGTATDIVTRGQFRSLNGNWWYFLRSNATSTVNDIVAVNCATAAVHSVTGNEFGGGGSVGSLRTGSTNTTPDPRFALEMQARRSPVGGFLYFLARNGFGPIYEDANLFRFDVENGGTAVQLTNNTGTGATAANVLNLENLTISPDGNHVAWTQRFGTAATNSEEVFHLDLVTNRLRLLTRPDPAGQTVTDGSLRFTGPSDGLVWSIGNGTTSASQTNVRVEWAALGSSSIVRLTPPYPTPTLIQVVGNH